MKKKSLLAILTALLLVVSFPSVSYAASATISADDSNYNLAAHGHANGDIITIAAGCAVTLVGAGGTTYTNFQIVCGAGVHLTLDDVNIDNSAYAGRCPLVFNGTGNMLTLAELSDCTLTGGQNKPAVQVNEGRDLTIGGSGKLTATGGENAPGIGSGESSGAITIAGGVITAQGGAMAPGIGCGRANEAANYAGDVTVSGGTVYAYGGYGGAGIGSGYGGNGVAVTMTGGTLYAGYGDGGTYDIGPGQTGTGVVSLHISSSAALLLQHDVLACTPSAPTHTHFTYTSDRDTVYGLAIPEAWTPTFGAYLFPCTLTYDLNGVSGTAPPSVTLLYGQSCVAANGSVYAPAGYSFDCWNTKQAGSGTRYAEGDPVILTASIKLYAWFHPKIHADGTYHMGSEIQSGDVVVIAEGLNVTITSDGSSTYTDVQLQCCGSVALTLSNVKIDNSGCTGSPLKFIGGNNTLTLPKATSSALMGGTDTPAICVPELAGLTIGGAGALKTTGGGNSAGIGSNAGQNAGTITITGGTVTAIGPGAVPGIGGKGVIVNLTGGTVFAGCSSMGSGSWDIGPGPGGGSATTNISGTARVFLRHGLVCNIVTSTHMDQYYSAGTTSVEGIAIPSDWTDNFGAYLRYFTLTYDLNGGTGTKPADVTKLSETSVNLASGSGLSKAHYVFAGWNTAANGGGTAYATGDLFTFMGDKSLYAMWLNEPDPPTLSAQPQNAAVVAGSTASFSVTATGTGLTYQWQSSADGGATWGSVTGGAGADTATYTTPITTASMNGWKYRCTVTNTTGNVTSNAASLTVLTAPVLSAQPQNAAVVAGGTASFSVSATGTGLTYQWQSSADGGATWGSVTGGNGADAATYTTPITTASMNGWKYRCAVTNAAGTVYSDPAALTVNPEKVTYTVTVAPGNASYGNVSGGGDYLEGSSVTVTASAKPGYFFCGWYNGGALMSLNASYTFTVSGSLTLTAQFDKVGVPASITAKSSAFNKLTVAWGAVKGAKGYQVYRATSANGAYKLVKTLTGRTFTDSNLKTGTAYYYKVRAYIAVKSKKVYGNFYSAVSTATPKLNAVTGIKAAKAGTGKVRGSWKAVPGASKYELWRSTSAGGTYVQVCVTSSKTWTNKGLTRGLTYYYMVRAYRTVGSSKVYTAYSSAASAKP